MVVIRLDLSFLSSVHKHYVDVLWLGFSLLSSFSKHNAYSYRYYGWVCRCCHQSIKTIYGGIIVVVVRQ